MQKQVVISFFAVGSLALCGAANAAHPALGGGAGKPAGPITTMAAAAMPKGMFAVDLQAEFIRFDTFAESELLAAAGNDEEIHNAASATTYTLGLSLGLGERLGAHVSLPYVIWKDVEESEPPDEIHQHGDGRGIGDLDIHLHRTVWETIGGFEAALMAGLQVPTGETDVKDGEGNRFDAEFQPGSGAWNPSVGAAASQKYGPFSFHSELGYTWVGKGTQDTDLGDRLHYNVAAVYRVRPPLRASLVAEANGVWQDREVVDGVESRDSGGHVILISPGIRFRLGRRLSAYASAGLPVYQDLNGDQNDLAYRLLFGVSLVPWSTPKPDQRSPQ